jgi:mannose/cellobiose epimerase-like protein (N-acyl-D-glucosamine 2-epimerase family)
MLLRNVMTPLLIFCVSTSVVFSQYQVKSPYLQNPQAAIGYVDSCARFWMKAYEPTYGGFYTNINRQGVLSGSSYKNTLNQSRDAYGFIRAFQLTGDTTYLRYARYALDFMYSFAWDKSNGGWYNEIGKTGTAISPSTSKTAYYQHYAMLGIAAAYEATRDTNDWNWLMKSYAYNDAHLWDSSASAFGYYDNVAANGTNPTDKSFNATVDAVTTHMLHLYLMTGDERYRTRLLQLADNMINRLAASAQQQAIGFAESYNTAWEAKSSDTRTIMGHVLKTGWCLARIYQHEKNPLFLSTAEQLVQIVLDKGYDHQNGGPYKDYDRITSQMIMSGITDTAKAWWQMEQAVTAGLMLFQVTGKEKYLQMADETLDFFMKYFVDHVYGDVFENTNKYGGLIAAWGTTKGNSGKAGYHSIETGYYTYLYGTLLLKKEPATLCYRFTPENRERILKMRPIAVPAGYLRISKVTLNGASYANYAPTDLTLTLPAGTGGAVAVTYEPAPATAVASRSGHAAPEHVELMQNYPNPFNSISNFGFSLPAGKAGISDLSHVTLRVYDLLGREVATLVNEPKKPGNYTITWDASGMASGAYLFRLTAGTFVQSRRMLLLR